MCSCNPTPQLLNSSTPQRPQLPNDLNLSLTTSHSIWLAPLCLLLGVAVAWLLYRRAQSKDGFDRRLALGLGVVRALVIALIAFFLLEPMVRIFVREVRKPVVVIAHDGSSSIGSAGDTAFVRSGLPGRLQELADRLGEKYEVRTFTYGQELRDGLHFDQQDALTDISQVFRGLYDRFNGPDLGAVIIDGDGIYNRGRDPRSDAERIGVPVHVIALGDTTVYPDLVLRSVEHNRISYLGNEFPLLVRVEARHLRDARTRVSVMQGGREVAGQDLPVNGDPFFAEIPFSIKAEKAGLQAYTVVVRSVSGEATEVNNSRTIHVDVLDDRQKILLLGAAPHPDLGAIRFALSGLDGYEAVLAYANDFSGVIDEYDLVILHGLPSVRHNMIPLLQRASARNIPVLHILAQGMEYNTYNTHAVGVQVIGARQAITDAQAAFNKDFTFFTLDPEQVRAIERFPPLQVPFGQYELGRGATALLHQKVGMVRTQYPLIAIQQQGERRTGVVSGEGLWRWRLADMQMNNTHQNFDRLMHKLVQFLALKVNKNRFRVEHAPEFAQSDPVIFNAELYNATYELVNIPEATIVLEDEDGRDFPYTFSRTSNAYRLDAGRLPTGRYTWKANVDLQGERFSASGEVTVRALMAEQLSTVADHGLWQDIAARTGGSVVNASSIDGLADVVSGNDQLVARSYTHASFSDLIGLRWIFFALLALLTLEWALRRRNGAY